MSWVSRAQFTTSASARLLSFSLIAAIILPVVVNEIAEQTGASTAEVVLGTFVTLGIAAPTAFFGWLLVGFLLRSPT